PTMRAIATTMVATAVVIARIVARRLITSGNQPIPGAPPCVDHCAVIGPPQLRAKSADIHLDDVGIAVEVEIPNVVEDVAFRQHLVGMMQQVLEDRELAAGGDGLLAEKRPAPRRWIQPRVARLEHRRPGLRTATA